MLTAYSFEIENAEPLRSKRFSASKIPVVGVEPTRPRGHGILSPARLPIPPHRHVLEAVTGFEPVIKVLQTSALPLGYTAISSGAEDGIRTRDPHLGKVMFYH